MILKRTLAILVLGLTSLAWVAHADELLKEIKQPVLTIQAGKVSRATVTYSANGNRLGNPLEEGPWNPLLR